MSSEIQAKTQASDQTLHTEDHPETAADQLRTAAETDDVSAAQLGRALQRHVAEEPHKEAPLVQEILNRLPVSERETAAREFVKSASQSTLDQLAGSRAGAAALRAVEAELATADTRLLGNDPQRAMLQRALSADNPQKFVTAAAPGELAALTDRFVERFGALAQDRTAFHTALNTAFGSVDYAAAEQIRVATLNGDTSWMPSVNVIAGGNAQVLGAYAADQGTVFLNESILIDRATADAVFAEEVGHHLQTRVRAGDSPGDEGALFERLLSGNKLTPQNLQALRNENDHGVMTLNGKVIAAEFHVVEDGYMLVDGVAVRWDEETGWRSADGRIAVFNEHEQLEFVDKVEVDPVNQIENGEGVPGTARTFGDGQVGVRSLGRDYIGVTEDGILVNGRIVQPEDGFGDWRTEKVPNTNNLEVNWSLQHLR